MDITIREGVSVDTLLHNYKFGKTLGVGSFGKVKIADHRLTGYKVAVKILNRRKLKNLEMEEKVREVIRICKFFVHPNIVRIYEVIETPIDIYIVMEYVKSGELFDYIIEKGRLHENEACKIFQQIIFGVEYCHRNMVLHRDLKLENILLDSNGNVEVSRGNVKAAGFGLSNIMIDEQFLKTSCGSPYAAPEVVSGKLNVGPEVDVWSCGVILYALLCGNLPFDDENIPNLIKKIKGGIFTLPNHLSPGARDLILKMLTVDPIKRITIADLRDHYWFKSQLSCDLPVPAPDATNHLKTFDEDIIKKVINMGFERNHLIQSLQSQIQDDATVAYYLLFDNQTRVVDGYLGAENSESLEGDYVPDRSQMSKFIGDDSFRSNM